MSTPEKEVRISEINLWADLEPHEAEYCDSILAMVHGEGVDFSSWEARIDEKKAEERRLVAQMDETKRSLNSWSAEFASLQESSQMSLASVYTWMFGGGTSSSHEAGGHHEHMSEKAKYGKLLVEMNQELKTLEAELRDLSQLKQDRRLHSREARDVVIKRMLPLEDQLTQEYGPVINVPHSSAGATMSMWHVLGALDEMGKEVVLALGFLYSRLQHLLAPAIALHERNYAFAYHRVEGDKSVLSEFNTRRYLARWRDPAPSEEAVRICSSGRAAYNDVDVLCAQALGSKDDEHLSGFAVNMSQDALCTLTELLGMQEEMPHALVLHLRRSIIVQAKTVLRVPAEESLTSRPRHTDHLLFYPLVIVMLRNIRPAYRMVREAEFNVLGSIGQAAALRDDHEPEDHIVQRKAVTMLGHLVRLGNIVALKSLVQIATFSSDMSHRALACQQLAAALDKHSTFIVDPLADILVNRYETGHVRGVIEDALVDMLANGSLTKVARHSMMTAVVMRRDRSPRSDARHRQVWSDIESKAEDLRMRRKQQSLESQVLGDHARAPKYYARPKRLKAAGVTVKELRDRHKDVE